MVAFTTAEIEAVVIQLLIVGLVARRSYQMAVGVPFVEVRLYATVALGLVLWAVSALESTLLTPWAIPYLLAADAVVLVVTGWAFAPVAERATEPFRDASGRRSYRIPFSLAALFLIVYLARLAVTLALFPASLEYGALPAGYPSFEQQGAVAAIDLALSFSVGLLVARSVGVRRKLLAAP